MNSRIGLLASVALGLAIAPGIVTAQIQALFVDSVGNIGVGTMTPGASLEVTRDDGSSQVLVREANASVGVRTLFKLENKGNTKFTITNTDVGSEWGFTNSNGGTEFRVSKQGSGVVEFSMADTGNLTIAGNLTENSDVNQKTDIRPVDSHSILETVAELPISQWQYKDTPGVDHIGPMAQDFRAAFGLGASETGISTLDTSGVALVAIKALVDRNQALEERNQALEQRVHELEKQSERIARLEAMILDLADRGSVQLTRN